MELMEIVLLAVGGIIFILSFFIPDKKGQTVGAAGGLAEKEIRDMLRNEMETLRGSMNEMAQEAVADALDKTERSLERLTNEKIMAVSEYSDTVLGEIHKNHEEAVFLYDMLNNKHVSLKNTAAEVSRTVKEAEKSMTALKENAAPPSEGGSASKRFPAEKMGLLKKEPPAEKAVAVLSAREIKESLPDAGEKRDNHNEKILKLYREGKSAVAIAKELGLGVGEVRLVIAMTEMRK